MSAMGRKERVTVTGLAADVYLAVLIIAISAVTYAAIWMITNLRDRLDVTTAVRAGPIEQASRPS